MIWYVSYGSNMDEGRLVSYLQGASADGPFGAHRAAADPTPPKDSRWIQLDHELFFAGESSRWGGSVAFLSVDQGREPSVGRAYMLSWEQFLHLAAHENSVRQPDWWSLGPDSLRACSWLRLPVGAKYDALMRLPDIDGLAAYTISTARSLEKSRPTEPYLAVLAATLANCPLLPDPANYLGRATERSSGTIAISTPPAAPLRAQVRLRRHRSTGYPSVLVDRARLPWLGTADVGLATVRIERGNARPVFVATHEEVELEVDPESSAPTLLASTQLLWDCGLPRSQSECWAELEIAQPTSFRALSARSGDVALSDHIQVSAEDATRLGHWALIQVDRMIVPVRVEARDHVKQGQVRINYALRNLLGLRDRPRRVSVQPLASGDGLAVNPAARAFRNVVEWLLGAPTVSLRAYEGLVGDDALPIVRVDPTALDFIGVQSGDSVVVTWARRYVQARVLLQDDTTRDRMERQLLGTTQQIRMNLVDDESRRETPAHLRVWVSSRVRSDLGIPVDTVVRIRRSLGHVVLGQTSTLAFPVAGLFIAAIAVPDVWWFWWLCLLVVVIVLAIVPTRLK